MNSEQKLKQLLAERERLKAHNRACRKGAIVGEQLSIRSINSKINRQRRRLRDERGGEARWQQQQR